MEEGKRIVVMSGGLTGSHTRLRAQLFTDAGMQLVVEPTVAEDYQNLKGLEADSIAIDEYAPYPVRNYQENIRILQSRALKRRAKK